MRITDIITKKRDGLELSENEISYFVKGVTDGSIPDYQTSAFLMAAYINGMNDRETLFLTLALAQSGDLLDLSDLGEYTVDKHSTGGVGDKTSLICAPIAAALGCTVAKMSGRGLGHTGGTIDKLESITGYNTDLDTKEFFNIADNHGLCITGQNKSFAPADGKLYALRDVTATVESIPLIASSIMSKKLAAGAKTIVLDVKCGSGAFMKTPEAAEKLAALMVNIGNNAGRKTVAVITDMEIPLGRAIGNALEVKEASEILKGGGDNRLRELSVILAANMYSASKGIEISQAVNAAEQAIESGAAFGKLCELMSAHGGDIRLLNGEKPFKTAERVYEFKAEKSGYISGLDSLLLGRAAMLCGAGRENLETKIDPLAGIVLLKHYGDYAEKGDIIAEIHTAKEIAPIRECMLSAVRFSEKEPPKRPLIYKIIK